MKYSPTIRYVSIKHRLKVKTAIIKKQNGNKAQYRKYNVFLFHRYPLLCYVKSKIYQKEVSKTYKPI